MCLITLAYRVHPEYPLILAANRDEFHARPTAPAHEWSDHPGLIAGRDLQAGGTWLGLFQRRKGQGRLAALTNVREVPSQPDAQRSRGELVTAALVSSEPLPALLAQQLSEGEHYQGFNLLAADAKGLYYSSNRREKVQALSPGVYGLSNATLDVPWPKVRSACQAMDAFVAEPGAPETLIGLLGSTRPAPDDQLPDTGIGFVREKGLSAEFIRLPEIGYGTRASTAVMIDRSGQAHMHEQNFSADGQPTTHSAWIIPEFW